jgi:hypothetical protein
LADHAGADTVFLACGEELVVGGRGGRGLEAEYAGLDVVDERGVGYEDAAFFKNADGFGINDDAVEGADLF